MRAPTQVNVAVLDRDGIRFIAISDLLLMLQTVRINLEPGDSPEAIIDYIYANADRLRVEPLKGQIK